MHIEIGPKRFVYSIRDVKDNGSGIVGYDQLDYG